MNPFEKNCWVILNGSFEPCTSWKMSDTMTPSRMRRRTQMAVKAFERSPSRTALWAICPHKSPWVRLHSSTRYICVPIQLCLCVSARHSSVCSVTQMHIHTHETHAKNTSICCESTESQMASRNHALRRSTRGEGLTWKSSLGPALL